MTTMSRCALLAALAALAVLGSALPAAAASGPASPITVLAPADLDLTGDSIERLTIRNDSAEAVGLQFSLGTQTDSGGDTPVTPVSSVDAGVTVVPATPTTLAAHATGQFDVKIKPSRGFDGFVCVGVDGPYVDQKNGTTIALSIRTTPWWKQPTVIVIEAIVIGIVFIAVRWRCARNKDTEGKWKYNGQMGAVEWDFGKSFGTLTGLFAGVITVVVATGLLPEADTPSGVSLLGLSLIFDVMLLLAPLFYTVFQQRIVPSDAEKKRRASTEKARAAQLHEIEKPEDTEPPDWLPITTKVKLTPENGGFDGTLLSTREDEPPDEEIVGYVLAFLVTSALTIGAVTGQAFTTYLMLEQLHDYASLAIGIRVLEFFFLPVGAVLLVVHFWRTLGWIVDKQHREVAARHLRQAPFAEPVQDRPRWTPL